MNFGAGILIGPQIVAGDHRPILNCVYPIVFAGGTKRNRALGEVQAAHTPGRIVGLIVVFVLRFGEGGELQN